MSQEIFKLPSGLITTTPTTIFTAGPNQLWDLMGFTVGNIDTTVPITTFRSVTITIRGTDFAGAVTVQAQDTLDWGPEGRFVLEPGDEITVTASEAGLSYFFNMRAIP